MVQVITSPRWECSGLQLTPQCGEWRGKITTFPGRTCHHSFTRGSIYGIGALRSQVPKYDVTRRARCRVPYSLKKKKSLLEKMHPHSSKHCYWGCLKTIKVIKARTIGQTHRPGSRTQKCKRMTLGRWNWMENIRAFSVLLLWTCKSKYQIRKFTLKIRMVPCLEQHRNAIPLNENYIGKWLGMSGIQ